MIGRTFGSYQVTAKLGEGGMGAVYLAEHTLLGKKAAVKVLLGEHAQRADLVARFFTEAKAAASLAHPALIEVFDFGIAPDGVAFIVMEFLQGESLGSRLEKLRILPPEQVVDIARQVASGVGAAHGKGIVHRDLKPDNIFLLPDPDGGTRERVKVLDFGIAKLVGDGMSRGATSTGMVLGTPLFMAPEQCRGSGQVDLRADIYSLGCILMMMLCGRPPFLYEGVGEILAAHLTEAAPLVRTFNPQVSPALEAVVARTLAKDPAARFANMPELSAALAQAINTGASSLPPTPKTALLVPTGGSSIAALPSTTLSQAAGSAADATDVGPPPGAGSARGRGKLWLTLGGLAVVAAVGGAFVAGRRVGDEEEGARGGGKPPAVRKVAHEDVGGKTMGANGAMTNGANGGMSATGATAMGGAGGPASVAGQWPGGGAGGRSGIAQAHAERAPDVTKDVGPEGSSVADAHESPAAGHPEKKGPPKTKLPKDATLAFASARAALSGGRDKDALESFRMYLSLTSGASSERMEAQRQVIELQRRFGEVEVVCDVQGATLAIDGRFAGTTPFRRSLILAPGSHQLVVSKPGYRAATRDLSLRPGERQAVVFSLH